MKTLRSGLLCLIALISAGCANTLTQGGALVKISDSDTTDLKECNYLGIVKGKSTNIHFYDLQEDARIDARNKAAEMGATHLVFTDLFYSKRVYLKFKAFSCRLSK